jgi:hypothetical protein
MIRSSLAAAFVTSFTIHLGALVVVSLSPGLLRAPSPPPDPAMAELLVEPVTSPKIIEKPEPRRAEPRPKSPLPPKPARLKKPVPPKSREPEPVPSRPTEMADAGGAKPGPRMPIPDDAQNEQSCIK